MSDPARPIPSLIDPLKDQLTCRNGGPHYCPNCDHAIAIDLQEVAKRYKSLSDEHAALLAHRAQLEELIPALSDYSYKAALMAQLAPDEGTRNAFKKFGAAFGKVVAVLSSGEGSGDHP